MEGEREREKERDGERERRGEMITNGVFCFGKRSRMVCMGISSILIR